VIDKLLFRRRPKPIGKLATDLDPKRTYFAGLLLRADEGRTDAISFATELKPDYSPLPLPEFASESERAGFAALEEASGIVADAMEVQGKLMVGTGQASIFEGAIGICYGLFIINLFRLYLKDDGVEIDYTLLGNFAASFARLFVYLDDAKKDELRRKGLEIYLDLLRSDHQNVKDWHDLLSKTVQSWLISTTSDKRTKELDEEYQKIFAAHLSTLYRAVE